MKNHSTHPITLVSVMLLTFLISISASHAAPSTFDDGGTVDGSFTYHPETDSITDWNFAVSGGSISNFNYLPANSSVFIAQFPTGTSVAFSTPDDTLPFDRVLNFTLLEPLTPLNAVLLLASQSPVSFATNASGPISPCGIFPSECISNEFIQNLSGVFAIRYIPEPAFFTLSAGSVVFTTGQNNAVPEPSSLLLLGAGFVGLAAWRRKYTA